MHEIFQNLFRSFHNLNLLTLRNNLRLRRVCRGEFIKRNDDWLAKDNDWPLMCPLTHGAQSFTTMHGKSFGLDDSLTETARLFIADWDFKGSYDGFHEHADLRRELLAVLDAIWDQRLADADAVQDVIASPAAQETTA